MKSAKTKGRSAIHFILLLPFVGAAITASVVTTACGPHGFDFLWVRVSPGAMGALAFGALVALAALVYLARGGFR